MVGVLAAEAPVGHSAQAAHGAGVALGPESGGTLSVRTNSRSVETKKVPPLPPSLPSGINLVRSSAPEIERSPQVDTGALGPWKFQRGELRG